MRKLLLALVALVVVAVGAIGLAAANLNTYLNDNRDQLAAQARDAIGRDVRFGEVGVSFARGLGVRIEDVAVAEAPSFDAGADFVSARLVDVRVAILPALFGDIRVRRVVLREPTISLIRTKAGLSIDGLGGGASGGSAPGDATEGGGADTAAAVFVGLIDVRGGVLRYVDRTTKPVTKLEITAFDFEASDVSLDQPIEFQLSAALLGAAKQNVSASGVVGPMDAESPRVDVSIDLGPLPVESVLAAPAVAGALPEGFSGEGPVAAALRVEGTVTDMTFEARLDATDASLQVGDGFQSAAGSALRLEVSGSRRGDAIEIGRAVVAVDRTELEATGRVENLASPKLAFDLKSDALYLDSFGARAPEDVLNDLALAVTASLPDAGPRAEAKLRSPGGSVSGHAFETLALDFALRDQRAAVQEFSVRAYGGSLTATGAYDMRGATPRFDAVSKLTDLRTEQLAGSDRMSGGLYANVSVAGAGTDWAAIKPKLTGKGDFQLRDGVLRGTNLVDEVLSNVAGVPGLSTLAPKSFREKHPHLFDGSDTAFERADGRFDIGGGFVQLEELEVTARDYALSGRGRYDLDDDLDVSAVITLAPGVSDDLVDSVKEAKYLRVADGRVAVPARITGPLPGHIRPDVSAIANAASQNALEGLLKDKLKLDDSEGDTGSLGDLLGKGLGGLLKKR